MVKILIVEDDPVLNQGYEIILRKEGYDVTVAENGVDGLTLLQRDVPDLLLLDLMLPAMSGLELLEKINKKKNYTNLKVLVFSNMSDPEGTKVAMDLGADRFINKFEFTPKAMVQIVKELVQSVSDTNQRSITNQH